MSSSKEKLIMLAAGGTGGHLFPAIAVAEELNKHPHVTTHLVTDLRCKDYLPQDLSTTYHIINIHIKLSGLLNKVFSIANLFNACIKSLLLVGKIKPDIIVGFGGYPSFPVLLAAKILRIPIIVHEQNCFLGKSNRLFANTAKIIALSYKETPNISKYDQKKIIITGDIIRSQISSFKVHYNAHSTLFNIFVVGGSQGAKIFSTLIPEAITELIKLDAKIKDSINIIQQVRKDDYQQLEQHYKRLGIEYELSNFFHHMSDIYAKTQLVIARAGAGTVAELAYTGTPAIFIPLPSAMEDHQFLNANAIAEAKGGWCYRQKELNAVSLAHKLYELINHRSVLEATSSNLLKRKQHNASQNFADTILKIVA
ncbi:MAG: undecaprenyldiphospho-muramoylpentapeptide beta-N-acetylglucosaminyltransferase [Rickettsiaceae bacterium]